MTTRGTAPFAPSGGDGLAFCFVGHERYAILDSDVRFIVRVEQMRQDRGADGRLGTLASGGQQLPVYSLATQLGRKPGLSSGRHIVVTVGARDAVGWLVDRVARSARGDRLDVVPLPAVVGPSATRWFKGLLKFEENACLLVSPADLDPRASAAAPSVTPAPRSVPVSNPRAAAGTGVAPSMIVMFASRALPACGVDRYGLSARQVAALVPSLPSIPVPGSARHVNGVALWREAAVPIIDFREAGARAEAGAGNRHLMVQCGARLQGTVVALPIGADVALYRATMDDRPVVTGTSKPEFVMGVFRIGDNRLALLDLDILVERAGTRPRHAAAEHSGPTQPGRAPVVTANETHR